MKNFVIIQLWILIASFLLFFDMLYNNQSSQVKLISFFPLLYSLNIAYIVKKLKIDSSKALFWLTVSFILYHVLPHFIYYAFDVINYMDSEKKGILIQTLKSNTLTKAFLVSIVGFQSTILAYCFTKNKIEFDNQKSNYNLDIVYLSLGFFLIAVILRRFTPSVFLSSFETVNFLILSIYIFSNSKLSMLTKKRLAILTFFLSLIFFTTFTTGRRDLIKLIILFSVIWSLYVKPFRIISIIAGGFLSICIMFALVLYRTEFSINHVLERMLLILDQSDYLFLMLSSTLDFMPGHNNYEYIIANIPERSPYLFGASLFKIFFAFIPRQIWADKPSGVQELIVEEHRNIFVGGTSQTTTMIGEFYWNFGIIGVAIAMAVIGYICNKIDFNNLNKTKGSFQFMLRVILISWIIEFFRGGISTVFIVNSLQIIIPLVLLIFSYRFINDAIKIE